MTYDDRVPAAPRAWAPTWQKARAVALLDEEAEAAWGAECVKYELPPDTTFYFRIGQKADWMNGWRAAAESRDQLIRDAAGLIRDANNWLGIVDGSDEDAEDIENLRDALRGWLGAPVQEAS